MGAPSAAALPLTALALGSLPHGAEWTAVVLSYLLGAVPFGWLFARWIRDVDIRTTGSGNIGSANAGRVLGRPLGFVVFLLDLAKGWAPVFVIAPAFARGTEGSPWLAVLCGTAAVAGHVWPLYLRFKGGKAVATGCGAVVGVDPVLFVLGGTVWLVVLATTRFIGLSSMLMGASFPVLAVCMGESREVVLGTSGLAILILVRHRSNLMRMVHGTEPRMGRKSVSEGGGSHAR